MALERLRSCATTALFPHSAAKQRDPDSVLPVSEAQDKAVYEYVVSATSLQVSIYKCPEISAQAPNTVPVYIVILRQGVSVSHYSRLLHGRVSTAVYDYNATNPLHSLNMHAADM